MSPTFVFDCVQKSLKGEILEAFTGHYDARTFSIKLAKPIPSVFDPDHNALHFLILEGCEYQLGPVPARQKLDFSNRCYRDFESHLKDCLARPDTGLTLKAVQEFHWANPAPHGLHERDEISFKAACLIDLDSGVIADRVYHGLPCVQFDRMTVRTAYRNIDVKASEEDAGVYVVCDLKDFQADVQLSLPEKYRCQ